MSEESKVQSGQETCSRSHGQTKESPFHQLSTECWLCSRHCGTQWEKPTWHLPWRSLISFVCVCGGGDGGVAAVNTQANDEEILGSMRYDKSKIREYDREWLGQGGRGWLREKELSEEVTFKPSTEWQEDPAMRRSGQESDQVSKRKGHWFYRGDSKHQTEWSRKRQLMDRRGSWGAGCCLISSWQRAEGGRLAGFILVF